MGISRMLKVQLLGHSAIKDDLKRALREAGVIEITETSLEIQDAGVQQRDVRDLETRLELAQGALEFLDEFAPRLSFMEKISAVPLEADRAVVEKIEAESPVEALSRECARLQSEIRSGREELERSMETVSMLEPWAGLGVDLGRLSTAGYELQLWTLDEKSQGGHLADLGREFDLADFNEFARTGGSIYLAVIISRRESTRLLERMKEIGAHHHSWEHLDGSPSDIISSEKERWAEYRERIDGARAEAAELAERSRDDLRILADHYREEIGLALAEDSFYTTDSTFVLEGWVRAVDRPALERSISARFEETEISFRDPLPDERPPIYLDNRGLGKPYEFVTTLYGRPAYSEFDPTPLLAPFFILFFAMCLTDAGYGLTLSAIAAVILMKFKPSGGAGLLMKV
ncbi:MAG TPA: hypothetical protein VLA34_07360, partial [Candidatus Krumholzibacterium sp.]|nr:hypothetical protein [Candidatus Krumholzibacterium sp.]